ncbi:MAG: ABC transporter permease [Planctomycetes bacterium]|nr:ABC transporter permease [Planctomycetota bacterium]
MRKMIVVAVREYQAAVRTKAFIVSIVAMPIIMSGAFLAQAFLGDKVDVSDKHVAIVDYTGQLYDGIVDAARDRNESDKKNGGIFEVEGGQRKQVLPRFVIERVTPTSGDIDRVKLELSDRTRAGELYAFLVIGADVIIPPEANSAERDAARLGIDYHSNSPTNDDFRKWAEKPLNDQVHRLRLQAANLDPEVVGRAMGWTPVGNLGLVSLDAEGNIIKAKETNEFANFIVPMGLMMLMFMIINVGAIPLMHSVLEEKMQRIAEVLLGSIPPFQLMMGKLLGTVGVSLTIAMIYLLGAVYAVHRADVAALFPPHLVIWFVVFLALAILMFGSVFIAVGAAVTDMKEAQSLVLPVMIFVILPLFVWVNVVKEPSAPLSIALSLFPPATPMLMIVRQAVPPGVPVWQPLLGIVLVLLTTVLCVFAAGRVFRVGILLQGRSANFGQLVRWVIRG